jgi:hypothetical protein
VAQAGGNLDLAQEPLRTQRLGNHGEERLDGYEPVVTEVPRHKDFGHATAPHEGRRAIRPELEGIPPGKGCLKGGKEF